MNQERSTNRLLIAFLLSLFVLHSFAFAAVPAVVEDYIAVFIDLAKGKMGIIFVAAILGFSGFLYWRNGNLTPLLWGLGGSVLVGGAPYIAPKIITFGNTTFG